MRAKEGGGSDNEAAGSWRNLLGTSPALFAGPAILTCTAFYNNIAKAQRLYGPIPGLPSLNNKWLYALPRVKVQHKSPWHQKKV